MHYGPIMIDLEGVRLTENEKALLKSPRVGGILLFTRNYKDQETLKSLVKELRETAARPILIAVDHEGGRVWRFTEGFTKLPPLKQYGVLYEQNAEDALKLVRNAGWVMAAELLECGIDLSFSPVLDLDKGVSEVIGDRSFHRDPAVIVKLSKAFIEGMNQVGMSATGKHFPGHGSCALDSHIAQPVDSRDLEALWAEDIVPFRELSTSLGAIMPAHITYPKVDTVPAGFSNRWLQDILRGKLGFQGAIISDCLSMKGAAIGGDFVVRARMALDAGCDMVILSQQRDSFEVSWILEHLERDNSIESHRRLAALAGKFQLEARKAPKPAIA